VLMFAIGNSVPMLILGRAIMGIGAASALMTSFQAIVLWFPPARWPQLNGWILAAGGVGGIVASLPTALILHVTDWHGLMLGTAVVTLIVAIAVFALVPEREEAPRRTSMATQLRGLASVYRDRLFWRLAPVSATAAGCNLAFAGLWSGPWLKDVAGLGPDGIATSLFLLTILLTVGYVVIGAISTCLGRRGITLTQIIAAGILLSILLQLPLLLPTGAGRWVVMFAVGAFGSMGALAYPVLNGHFGPALSGRVSTAMNLFVFVGAFLVQYAVGALIDLYPQVAPGTYPAIAYQTAFGVMLLLEAASWVWFLLPARKS
jgi:predicted MFS family arabinose efflux permease